MIPWPVPSLLRELLLVGLCESLAVFFEGAPGDALANGGEEVTYDLNVVAETLLVRINHAHLERRSLNKHLQEYPSRHFLCREQMLHISPVVFPTRIALAPHC